MRDERQYLEDIAHSGELIAKYVGGANIEEFIRNEMLQQAVCLNFKIIGEAASKISKETRDNHPEIDGRSMISFRNIIVHAYFSLDIDIVWAAATLSVLPLSEQVRSIIRHRFPDEGV